MLFGTDTQRTKAILHICASNGMKIRQDSILNPFSNIGQSELIDKLEEDSLFIHYANIRFKQSESYSDKKIYFNRNNGVYWGSKSRHNSTDTVKIIGNLQNDNWYRF